MSLEELGTGQGYLKAGFLGFSKSGKSWTVVALAIGTHKYFDRAGRIVFFDTEGGSEYVAQMVRNHTGKPLLGKKSRSFKDLMEVAKELKENDVLIVDSITHPWRELCDAHLAKVNETRSKRGLKPRSKLEFQDWDPIKKTWAQWTDFYLNSKVHIIIAGRAGYEYDYEKNEETDKKELIKTGVKMRTESEFGFEPSLLVEMERVQVMNGKTSIVRRATVLGDRFNVLDGKQFDFKGGLPEAKAIEAVFKAFEPHIEMLKPGTHTPIDTTNKSDTGVSDDGDIEYRRLQRQREIKLEEIKAEFVKAGLDGNSGEAKKERIHLLELVFGTPSWTKVEALDLDSLTDCLISLKERLGEKNYGKEDARAEIG